ncbi:RNA polymerase sigma factor [Paenibacillus sp. JSM ZJ436]|uniref:RNA polymerase sigma factor n=1 Tax=Paenibacillus sp. JSM ZJ436 TaxID=3376190 RepID=UPI0037CB543B
MDKDAAVEVWSIEEIMNCHGGDVWNYAYFLTKDTEMADTISQDVFVKCYKSIGTFKGRSSLKSWLLSITRNTAYSYSRSKYFRFKTITAFLGYRDAVSPDLLCASAESAEKQFMAQDHVHEIWDHIMKLPDKFREILVLDLKFEMSIKEMSRLTGLAEGTVKSRLYRAREKVQSKLKEEDQ